MPVERRDKFNFALCVTRDTASTMTTNYERIQKLATVIITVQCDGSIRHDVTLWWQKKKKASITKKQLNLGAIERWARHMKCPLRLEFRNMDIIYNKKISWVHC